MKEINTIILTLLFLSCTSEKVYFVGEEYKSCKPSMFKTLFSKNITSYALGNTLILNKDSTYNKTTCAMFVNGRWFINKDTLFLKEETKIFKIDSLNSSAEYLKYLKTSNKFDYYIISRNHLTKKFKSNDGSEVIDQLKRTSDY